MCVKENYTSEVLFICVFIALLWGAGNILRHISQINCNFYYSPDKMTVQIRLDDILVWSEPITFCQIPQGIMGWLLSQSQSSGFLSHKKRISIATAA